MEKPVAGYFRVSQARDEMYSPDIYRGEIERYCDYRGLVLGRVYADIDHSGFRNSPLRPDLEALKEKRLEYSAVIVPKLSRFGRSVKDLVELFDLFDKDNVPLVFLDMNLDTSTSQGRLLRHVMAAFAEYESDVKGDYSRANNLHRVAQGRPIGMAPFGYRFDRNLRTFLVEPTEALLVQEIFELYLVTKSLGAVCRALNDRGLRTPRGNLWGTGTIGCKLTNPAYIGLVQYRGQLSQGTWPPIIERRVWDEVQAIRTEAVARYLRKNPTPGEARHLLTGLLRCAICGRKMYSINHSYKTSRTYICPGSRTSIGSQSHRCPGGTIGGARAERLVFDAFRDRYSSSVVDAESRQKKTQDLYAKWMAMSVSERRDFLALTIDYVELLPPDPSKPKARSSTRNLRIVWGDQWTKIDNDGPQTTDTSIDRGMKTCTGCHRRLPLSEYHKASKVEGTLHPRCKRCLSEYRARRKKRGPTWAEWRRELREARWAATSNETGTAPGWLLVVLMTAALGVAVWAVAGEEVLELLDRYI